MLQKIEINNLFNLYSYSIDLVNKDGYPIRFLTGPNGYGKTTLLDLIYSLLSGNLEKVFSIPFQSLRMYFDDLCVSVLKTETFLQDDYSDERRLVERVVTTRIERNGQLLQEQKVINPEEMGGALALFLNTLDTFYLTDKRIMRLSTSYVRQKDFATMADTLQQCASRLPRELFSDSAFHWSITDFEASDTPMAEDEYEAFKNRINPRIERLRRVGVIEGEFKWLVYTKATAYWMKSYMQLMDTELPRVEKSAEKLLLFAELVDKAGFVNKRLRMDKQCGFQFYTNESNPKPLLFEHLSSGECHLLLQLYALVFEAPEGALVLLDEPELSMHMYWQLHYSKLIAQLAKQRNLQCVVATHSPQILEGVWSHAVDLYRQLHQK